MYRVANDCFVEMLCKIIRFFYLKKSFVILLSLCSFLIYYIILYFIMILIFKYIFSPFELQIIKIRNYKILKNFDIVQVFFTTD